MHKSNISKPFYFRNFIIKQDKCAMKVGTDGMLLGALTHIGHAKKILDIGTGSGILALMAAQKSKAEIHAIEIDENAFEQATENIKNSIWHNRIKIFHSALQDFYPYKDISEITYDLIIGNPPFFRNSNSGKSKATNISRATARDHGSLNFEELAKHAARLLKHEGKFNLILPFDQREKFIQLALMNKLQLSEEISVRSKISKAFHRSILAFVKTAKPQTVNCKVFTIYEENDSYTQEYISATKSLHAADLSFPEIIRYNYNKF